MFVPLKISLVLAMVCLLQFAMVPNVLYWIQPSLPYVHCVFRFAYYYSYIVKGYHFHSKRMPNPRISCMLYA